MKSTIGAIAGGAAVVLAMTAGCGTSSTAKSASSSGGASSGGGGAAAQLSPASMIEAALTKATNDKTVTITGTITAAGSTGTMNGQEQFGSDFAISMNMTMAGQAISEVWTGNTIYIKIPALASELGGKEWGSIDTSSLGGSNNLFSSLTSYAKDSDPAQQLQPLLASGDLKSVGTETVNGVQATHYHGTVDPATAFSSTGASANLTAAQIAQLKSLFASVGATSDTIDVWIDGSGLPVKETTSEVTKDGTTSADINMTGWGQPVNIVAPPAGEVASLSSLMGAATGSTG